MSFTLKKASPSLVITTAILSSISPTFAAYPPQQSTSMRGVWVVTANSITIRTQPNPSAPAITTQSTGNNEVDTVPNETGTWSGGYH
ncbi:MAG: hypothetical protein ACXVDE_01155, partial [Tumebacillaceae bacterium]